MPKTKMKTPNLDKFKKRPSGKPDVKKKLPKVVSKEKYKKQVLKDMDTLPPLPTVVMQIMSLVNDPNSSIDAFESRIRNDQVLTAKILKFVNSSFYGLSTQIDSISRAVVVLGLNTLKSVVLAASTGNLMNRDLKVYGYCDCGLWQHSIICAGVARHLAMKVFNLENGEEAFVGGLLHDIGKIVITPILTRQQEEVTTFQAGHPDSGLLEMEDHVVGINHAEAGCQMLTKWNLPETLIQAIQSHHNCRDSSEAQQFNNLIFLADLLCSQAKIGLDDPYPWTRQISDEALHTLELTASEFEEIQADVAELIEGMQPVLESLQKG